MTRTISMAACAFGLLCAPVGARPPDTGITVALRTDSHHLATAAQIVDPVCRSFFVDNPPQLGHGFRRAFVNGSAEYPDCTGSAKNKALTRRTGEICLQIQEC